MLNLLNDDMRRNPFPIYAMLRASAPVFQPPGTKMFMLFDYESVKRAMTDHASFSSSVTPPTGKAPDWLIFTDPPVHARLRGIIMRAFTPRSIACLEPRVREISKALLDEKIAQGRMDLVADYSGPLPTIVIAEMIGIPSSDRAMFMRWAEAVIGLSHAMYGGEEALRAIKAHADAKAEMAVYLREQAAQRRKDPRDDLLTRLVHAEVDGEKLDEEDILGFFQLLLSAGTETTTNVLNNAVLSFLEFPAELERLRKDPALMPLAIEELVRFKSPAQMVFRQTRVDVELHGVTIPAGTFVLPIVGSANRDPSVFDRADELDVGRDPNPHIGFGHGIHFCIGAALGRMEAAIGLGDLVTRLKNVRLDGEGPWVPRKALNVHGPASLPIRFDHST